MDNLFMPMLYTSLTSAAGFASLALTPIPPVQVFGVFVALGVMAAWFLYDDLRPGLRHVHSRTRVQELRPRAPRR
jgi:predicted RND superfamily exporter protein